MMNKSLLAHSAKSSRNSIYGFQQVRILKSRCAKSTLQKKSRRFRRLLKLITGRRQTEWTGATRCPNKDDPSHKRESLINRKGAISFRLCLPCRPLAECGCGWRDGGESLSTSRPAKRRAAVPLVARSWPRWRRRPRPIGFCPWCQARSAHRSISPAWLARMEARPSLQATTWDRAAEMAKAA